MDHDGSKFLQTQLKFANQEERQLVYVEASTPIHTTRLIQDIFGNYVSIAFRLIILGINQRVLHV